MTFLHRLNGIEAHGVLRHMERQNENTLTAIWR